MQPALVGVTMDLAFVLGGTTSTNPLMLLLGFALVFFRRRSGRFGLDALAIPTIAARLPGRLRRLAHEMLFALALLASAALVLAVVGTETWAAMAVLSLIITMGGPGSTTLSERVGCAGGVPLPARTTS